MTSPSRTSAPAQYARALTDWWAKRTGRERWLAAIGIAFLAAASLWLAVDQLDIEGQRLAEARQAEFQARRLASRPDSLTDSEAALVTSLREASIQSPSLSLARLAAEQFMADAAARAGVEAPTVTVAADFEPDWSLPVLRAEISAPYSAEQLLSLTEALSDQQTWVAVRELEVAGASNASGGRMRLAVLIPVHSVEDEA